MSEPEKVALIELKECAVCGAIVADSRRHADWHAAEANRAGGAAARALDRSVPR